MIYKKMYSFPQHKMVHGKRKYFVKSSTKVYKKKKKAIRSSREKEVQKTLNIQRALDFGSSHLFQARVNDTFYSEK